MQNNSITKSSKEFASALVLFSGGQDSTTILAWAKNHFDYVEAISFNYGQKHSIELEQGAKICELLGIKRTLIDISFLQEICDSALTNKEGNVNIKHNRLSDLPASFVPNRNAILLTLANTYAQKIGINHLVTGTCETDYSGYPDCRRLFIDSLENNLFAACSKSKIDLNTIRYIFAKFKIIKNIDTHLCINLDDPVLSSEILQPGFAKPLSKEDLIESLKEFFGDVISIDEQQHILSIKKENLSYIYNLLKNTHLYGCDNSAMTELDQNNPHNVTKNPKNYFIRIHTPLMHLNKAQTFKMAQDQQALELVIEHSHTCYNGDRSKKFDWGYGCGECPACKLRASGYEQFLNSTN